jgi:hypothetical protein
MLLLKVAIQIKNLLSADEIDFGEQGPASFSTELSTFSRKLSQSFHAFLRSLTRVAKKELAE